MPTGNDLQLMAAGDIRPCRFIKMQTDANQEALEADANEAIIGISQEGTKEAPQSGSSALAAADGDEVSFISMGEVGLLKIGSGGCTAGDELKSDNDGQGVARASSGTTVQNVGAIALETASEGEFARVLCWRTSVRPALV